VFACGNRAFRIADGTGRAWPSPGLRAALCADDACATAGHRINDELYVGDPARPCKIDELESIGRPGNFRIRIVRR
jgi:hypothetical protein